MGKGKKKKDKAPAEPAVEPRARLTAAERRQRNQNLRWNPEYNGRSWMKFARCYICRKTFVVNNYPDHQVRKEGILHRGKICCAYCTSHAHFPFVLEAMILFEAKGKKKLVKRWKEAKFGSYAGGPN